MNYDRYDPVRFVGIDESYGRFGEVNIWRCKNCGRFWLHYFIEFEAFPSSGRFYMGLIPQEIAAALSPGEALGYLSNLDWHLYGGSYFGKKGRAAKKSDLAIWP